MAPVVRAARRPAEVGTRQEPSQRPAGVIVDVGGVTDLGPLPHHAGELANQLLVDDSPLVLPALRPGVGIEDVDPRQGSVGQSGDQRLRFAAADAQVREAAFVDRGAELGDAVDEGLAADEADIRVFSRARGDVLAAAEADLEPELALGRIEQGLSALQRREVDFEVGGELGDQPGMIGAQGLALAASVEGPALVRAGLWRWSEQVRPARARSPRGRSSPRRSRRRRRARGRNGRRPKCAHRSAC